MLNKIHSLGKNHWYWLLLVVAGVVAEVVALYYHHVLDFRPCVVCIHTRIWVLVFIAVALLGLAVKRSGWTLVAMHTAIALVMACCYPTTRGGHCL